MVRDASDAVVAPFEPYMLLSAATSAGSLVYFESLRIRKIACPGADLGFVFGA
jgi:hypothetical protein